MSEKTLYRLTDEECEKLRDATSTSMTLTGERHLFALWCQVAARVNCKVSSIRMDKIGDDRFFWGMPTDAKTHES